METQNRTEKIPTEVKKTASKKDDAVKSRSRTKTSINSPIEGSSVEREQARVRLREAYKKIFKDIGDSEEVAAKMIDVFDDMSHWPELPTEQEELTPMEKVEKFAELVRQADELGSTEVKFDLGMDIANYDGDHFPKPDFERPIVDQLSPGSFNVDLIRQILGEHGKILDMTPAEINMFESSQRDADVYPRVRVGEPLRDGFQFKVPTIFEGVIFELKVESTLLSQGEHMPTWTHAQLSN